MTDNFGTGVSRTLDPTATEYSEVVFLEGAPVCDAELSLIGQIAEYWQRKVVLRGTPSGWLSNGVNQSKVYVTDPSWSNWFQFGPQRAGDQQSIMWAVVNGWLLPITGTQTGRPPGSANNTDTFNKILLPPPPVSAGSARADFIFLECYKVLVSPNPSTLNKPSASAIYRFGNVEGGWSYLADDLIDPAIGEVTTDRTQIEYRIRVVSGLNNLSLYPDGFDPSVVLAQGSQVTPPVGGFTFTNMREILGDNGLWRAGDGNPANSLGTVDGFVYALPIAICFRRCSTPWSGDPSPNLNGSFNRNSSAVDRFGATTFSTVPVLAAPLSASATSFTINSITNIPLPATGGTIQIGDEFLTYSIISSTTIAVGPRGGVNGTVAEAHPIGTLIKVISGRPDGLFADQVTGTDILDLRHSVSSSGFDYNSLLQSNLDKLLRGQLRANWKRSGTDPRGTFVHFEDKISATPPAILGVTALDEPDHIRFAFSDAALQQPVEFIVTPIVSGPTFPLSPPTAPVATPPTSVAWDLQLPNPVMAISQLAASVWSVGDIIQLDVSQFKSSLPGSDSDQVRFLNEIPVASISGYSYGTKQFTDTGVVNDFTDSAVRPGDFLVIFTPLTGFPYGGTYPITEVTETIITSSVIIPTPVTPGPISYEIRRGVGSIQIRVEGSATSLPQHSFKITPANPTPSDDLSIQFLGDGSSFPTSASPAASQIYITTNVQYGGGRGLARRPDSVHNVVLVSPGSADPEILIQPSYIAAGELPLSTAWAPLWSKFRNNPYKGSLPETTGSYVDSGSKSIILQPFQKVSFIQNVLYLTSGGSIMPTESGYGSGSDPLSLFSNTHYVTLPRHLVPGFGAVSVPILPSDNTDFDHGINFMLLSRSITSDNPNYINYTNPYSIFSTLVSYNTASGSPLRAGIRFFNDDPTVGGALSTARGLNRKGLELPPYYGIARLFAVYEAGDFAAHGSAAANLLRQSCEGPTFWIERDDTKGGVSTFIINADIIDITKSIVNPLNSFTTYTAGGSANYVVESTVFGFGIGSFDLTRPFQLALVSGAPPSQPIPGPITVLPGPLPATATALVNYSRSVYQGDPWQTQSSGLDMGYTRGPLDSPTAYQLASSSLTASALTRPNQKPLEVLASTGFITSLGTGRLSGDFVQPNVYDPRNVGYQDPVDPSGIRPYPPTALSGGVSTPRPITKLGAIGSSPSFTDLEANPEYLGLTTRLPLGALYRDMDFHGGRFSDQQSSPLIYIDKVGAGSGVAGLTATEALDQSESPVMPADTSAGLPGDILVAVDGESVSYGSLTNFRTNRGGSAFIGSGDRPGGEIFATYESVRGSVSGSRTLVGRAFLVRNAPTTVGSTQVSAGDELMMAIVTQVMELSTVPSEAMILLGTNSSGESLSAADLYRIEGHPLIANHTFYDVDPTTVSLPIGKTITQIVAPPDVPVIPLGAANTVYASDGLRNFWTNAPTVVNLTATDILATDSVTIGSAVPSAFSSLVFTKTSIPFIVQASSDPGIAGADFGINSQNATATVSTISSFAGGSLFIRSGAILSPTPGWLGNSGQILVSSGNVASNVVGNSGIVSFGSGPNLGTGNTGQVSIASGDASNGNSGAVIVSAGSAIGTSGSGGSVSIDGGSVTNGANPSGNGGSVAVQAGSSLAVTGLGGSVSLVGGSGPSGNGNVVVLLGPSSTQYASFTNSDLILGASSGTYGLLFQPGTTTPLIAQIDAIDVNGQPLTIRAQKVIHIAGTYGDGGELDLIAGDGVNHVGGPSAHKGGDVIVSSGTCDYGFGNEQVILRIKQAFANPPIDAITCNFSEVLVGVNTIKFKKSSTPSTITQEPNFGGASGFSLSVVAQDADPASLAQSGGDLILSTGAPTTSGSSGTVVLKLGGGIGYNRVEVDESLGVRIRRNPGGGDTPITFEVSDNDPPVSAAGNNQLFVNNTNHLRYHSGSTGGSTAATLEGVVARIVDTSAFVNSPVTSSVPTNLLGGTVAFTGVLNGDIIEGHALVHVTAPQSVGNQAHFYLFVKDGLTIDQYVFPLSMSAATGVDQIITVPFSYTAGLGTTGTVEFRPEAASQDNVTAVTVSQPNAAGKWLFAKHIRP